MKNFMIAIIILLILGGGYYYLVNKSGTSGSATAPAPQLDQSVVTNTGTAISPMSQMAFSQSPDYAVAKQIFPGIISAEAKTAMQNFTMKTTTQADGSTMVTLTPKNAAEKQQIYFVKSGEKLYFVEKFPGDDASGSDNNLKDDYGIVVDASGNIVTQK
jgi:hypothetical protein